MRRWGPRRRGHLPRACAILTEFELLTERLRLRPFVAEDLDALERIFADEVMMTHYPHPFSRDESRFWIQRNQRRYVEEGFGLWAMEARDDGELFGDCGLVTQHFPDRDEVEIGWHTRRESWGQGVATEAARAVVRYAFGDLRLDSLISLILDQNVASQRVAEKLGMHVEGMTTHRDPNLLVYRLVRDEHE